MEILPNLRAIDFNGNVWAYLYIEADSLTLIDTGIAGDVRLILDEIDGLGRAVDDLRQVVLTHCHKDHAGTLSALQKLCDAPALAHRLDAPVIRGEAGVAEPSLSGPERQIFDRVAASGIPDAEPANVHRELEGGDELDIGGGATVVHVPGHTPGSIAVYVPRAKVLFTGDAVASISGRPFVGFFNVDPEQAKQSVRRLAELDFEVGCFGHGMPLTKEASFAFRKLAETA